MKAVKIDIQSAVFPDQFVSDSKKATQEFRITGRSSYTIRVV